MISELSLLSMSPIEMVTNKNSVYILCTLTKVLLNGQAPSYLNLLLVHNYLNTGLIVDPRYIVDTFRVRLKTLPFH